MSDFLFLWNPDRWEMKPERNTAFIARMDAAGAATECWSSGSRRHGIRPGDRAWLCVTGTRRGIFTSGRVISEVYENPDPEEPDHTVDIAWDPWIPTEDALRIDEHPFRDAQGSGVQLEPELAARVEMLWEQHPPARHSLEAHARMEPFWDLVDDVSSDAPGPAAPLTRYDSGTSPSAVPKLLSMVQGPLATALLRCYLDLVELPDETWSLSCLPQGSQTEVRRAYTLSIGGTEVLWAWLNVSSGRIIDWHARIGDAASPMLARLGIGEYPSHGGTYAEDSDALAFLSLMSDPDGAAALRAGAEQLSPRGTSTRRAAWHNPAFADLVLGAGAAPGGERLNYWEDTAEIPALYALAQRRERRHQQRFKRLLLAHQPHACAVCGFDEVELLEAAHLVPDSKAGPSSLANGRLLCPNHHRAHDAGYFRFDGTRVIWEPTRRPFGRPERGV